MFTLTELEHDGLTELVNIGVGRAAKNLSRMVKDQVSLSVPRTEVLTRGAAASSLSERERASLVAVSQDFAGSFSGRALLIFPEVNSLELVRAVIGNGPSIEDIIDLEQEALAEIGNVILNGCLVVMANTLRRGLTMSLPSVLRGDGGRILMPEGRIDPEEPVLFLYIDFAIRTRNIHGYIALLMDLPSLAALRELIEKYIADIGGDLAGR